MNPLLKSLIMFIYPAQCRFCKQTLDPSHGYYICRNCWEAIKPVETPFCEICGYPLSQFPALPEKVYSCRNCPDDVRFRRARSITDYDSAAGEAIRLLKYHGKTVMAKRLADLMAKAMPSFLNIEDYDCIIPVPIYKKKRRQRGYNQMELIGRIFSSKTGLYMNIVSLIKIKDTQPQASLSLKERKTNVKDAYKVIDPDLIAGKRILLIDDVYTTGTTVNECAKTLLTQGKANYIDVFTIARRITESEIDIL